MGKAREAAERGCERFVASSWVDESDLNRICQELETPIDFAGASGVLEALNHTIGRDPGFDYLQHGRRVISFR